MILKPNVKFFKETLSTIDEVFRPWVVDHPVSMTADGWEKRETQLKARYPIRYFLFDTVPEEVGGTLYHYFRDAKWWVLHRLHPNHRYHVIKTGLPAGYHDPDTLILHGSMNLFKEFMEGTEDTILRTGEQAEVWAEAQAIYDWWTKEFPIREKQLPEFPDLSELGDNFFVMFDPNHDDHPLVIEWKRIADLHNKMEEASHTKDEEMLIRLMKIRRLLWYP